MTKCQKEEKRFCKTQKYELQLLPAAGGFHKNELELFREDWPRRPPPSPDASGLPAFPPLSAIFLLLFHFLYPAYFSFFAGNLHTQPAIHPVRFLPAARTLRFHYFFVPKCTHSFASRHAFFRRQPAVILPAAFLSIRRLAPHIPALPATRLPYLFLSKRSQHFTSHHTFFRRQPAISYQQHSYNSQART